MPFAVQPRVCTPPESTAKRTYLFPAGILPQIFGQLLGMLARKQYMTGATPQGQCWIPAPRTQCTVLDSSTADAILVSPHVTLGRKRPIWRCTQPPEVSTRDTTNRKRSMWVCTEPRGTKGNPPNW
jgi:hypothetical protein